MQFKVKEVLEEEKKEAVEPMAGKER